MKVSELIDVICKAVATYGKDFEVYIKHQESGAATHHKKAKRVEVIPFRCDENGKREANAILLIE